MIFEIRNYHIRPERFEGYKAWAREHAVPFLATKLDLVGFWLGTDDANQVVGEPLDALGSANVTWILRWPDMAGREAVMGTLFAGADWEACFAKLPGGMENYQRIEVKFGAAVL